MADLRSGTSALSIFPRFLRGRDLPSRKTFDSNPNVYEDGVELALGDRVRQSVVGPKHEGT